MISKIQSILGSKISDQIPPEAEKSKHNSGGKNHDQHHSVDLKNSHEDNDLEKNQDNELSLMFSSEELVQWISELNKFDCYRSINLKFIMEGEGDRILVSLKNMKGHVLQEYLPLQIKAIHSQFKKDLAEIPKGTILNISC